MGYRRHSVVTGLPGGEVLEELEIEHPLDGVREVFSRIEKLNPEQSYYVAVAMEGYTGVHGRLSLNEGKIRGHRSRKSCQALFICLLRNVVSL